MNDWWFAAGGVVALSVHFIAEALLEHRRRVELMRLESMEAEDIIKHFVVPVLHKTTSPDDTTKES